jgi:hypothetical protein
LVVRRAVERVIDVDAVPEQSGLCSKYVAGTAVAYHPHNSDIAEIVEENVLAKVLRGAIIHPKHSGDRIMTLEADVRDLMYICQNFDI